MVENTFSASALFQHVLQSQQILCQAEAPGSDLLRVHYQQLLEGDQVRALLFAVRRSTRSHDVPDTFLLVPGVLSPEWLATP